MSSMVIKKRRTVSAKALSANLGVRILVLCGERKWSQRQLAAEAGLDPGYISRIVNGTVEPGLGTLGALAAAFGLDLGEFLKGLPL